MLLPPVLRIEPASSCNLRCQHCPTGMGLAPSGIMSIELFDRIVSQVSEHFSQIRTVVLYHGGEPLLNSQLASFIRKLKDLGCPKVKIVTNGKLLSLEESKKLINSGLDEIEVSLDGLGPDDSNQIRVRSDADKILESVDSLLQEKEKLNSKILVSISSTQFIDDYTSDFETLGAAPVPAWLKRHFGDRLIIKPTWAVQWPGGSPHDKNVVFVKPNKELPSTCSLLDDTVTIRANGDVVVCCYDLTSLNVMGNVAVTPLTEILSSTKYTKFKSDFGKNLYAAPCSTCAVVTGPKYLGKKKLLKIV